MWLAHTRMTTQVAKKNTCVPLTDWLGTPHITERLAIYTRDLRFIAGTFFLLLTLARLSDLVGSLFFCGQKLLDTLGLVGHRDAEAEFQVRRTTKSEQSESQNTLEWAERKKRSVVQTPSPTHLLIYKNSLILCARFRSVGLMSDESYDFVVIQAC